MIHIKYLWDKSEVNINQALNLISNKFEVTIWASNDIDTEGGCIKIYKDKRYYIIDTATTKHISRTPYEAIQRAIMILLLWY